MTATTFYRINLLHLRLVLSTELIRQFGYHEEIRVLTFRALTLRYRHRSNFFMVGKLLCQLCLYSFYSPTNTLSFFLNRHFFKSSLFHSVIAVVPLFKTRMNDIFKNMMRMSEQLVNSRIKFKIYLFCNTQTSWYFHNDLRCDTVKRVMPT